MPPKDIDKPKILSSNLFPVVGIGASAGGLDAFKKLLKAIPENSGMAYVLVQHLNPKHESMLPELLQKVTKIPVLEITDDIKVQPDHIYVIPSNKMMVATDGVLLLAARPPKSNTERNLPIDLFFTSLAEVHQDHAIGVVLSGTASDGTLGLKAIKENGGITFAQDEASAEYDGMPHNAIQAGVVDFVLPPGDIPKKLLEVTNKTVLSDEELQSIPKEDEDVFKQILSLLRIRKGVDFTYYKQTTIRRRILRRMVVNKNEEPADYLKFLRGNTLEQDLLYQDMLIPVTSFFRDKSTFEDLCNNVFPTIIKNKIPGDITRIWVAGCSTGQEVFSFAMCLKEFLGDDHERVQIFGTDLSGTAITKARTGIFEKSEMESVSPERVKEFFTQNNGGYQVNKTIRDMCVFAHHNFLKDPPFGKMDCVSCRNVLIYMEPYLQKKALTTFHYALNPKGFLLLGKSETTSGVPDLFAAVQKSDKLYTRKNVPGRFMQVASQRSEQILNRLPDSSKNNSDRSGRTDFQKTADDILLTKYTPAGVVVNETTDIVHFRGNTANYLEQAPGKPSHNLLMMAKHGLGFELRNILHQAKTDKVPVIKENIPLNVHGNIRNISIEAVPLPNTPEHYYLILFHDNNLTDTDGAITINKKKVSDKTKKEETDIRIQLLEQELAQAREDMRSITEDQEAANEELQSANEELLSGSEELQSLNEELETSKEELQSTNEELTVLNHELVGLNEQVTDARNYSESIVATLYQPLLVLDKNLRVKSANKTFYKTFRVDEQETEGVLIYDLGNRQWNIPELRTLLEEILPQKKQVTEFEVSHNFNSIGERIILLSALELTREKKEEKLILLSIEDVTERKLAQIKLTESEQRFQAAIAAVEGIVWTNNAKGEMEGEQLGWSSITGQSYKEYQGYGWAKAVHPDDAQPTIDAWNEAVKDRKNFVFEHRVKLKNGNWGHFSIKAIPLLNADGTIREWVGVHTDITELTQSQDSIKASEAFNRTILESSPDCIKMLDAEGRLQFMNTNGICLLEIDNFKEVKNTYWWDMWEPHNRQIIKDAVATAKSGEKIQLQLFSPTAKGTPKWWDIIVLPVEGEGTDKNHPRLLSVSRDITEQKLNELKEKELLGRFQTLVFQAPVAICVLRGRNYVIETINEGMIQMWDRKIDDVINRPAFDVLPEFRDQGLKELLDNVYNTGERIVLQELPLTIRRYDRMENIFVKFLYEPLLEADGTVSGVMALAHEITEQVLSRKKIEESEAHFRLLADLMPVKISNANAGGNVTYFNKSWLEFSGYNFGDLKDFGYHKMMHPDEVEEFQKRFQKAAETQTVLEMELRFLNKKGEYIWHLNLASPVLNDNGEIKMWVGVTSEIQQQKEQRDELELAVKERTQSLLEANHDLEHTMQNLEQFAYVASHDLQEPLRKIQTFATRLQQRNDNLVDAGVKADLARITASADRMRQLINDLLEYARLVNHSRSYIACNLNAIIDSVVVDFDLMIAQKNAVVNLKTLPVIEAIPLQMNQLFYNLIGNALKFSKEGEKPVINISAKKLTADQYNLYPTLKKGADCFDIEVTDNGIGFNPDFADQIFTIFQRLHDRAQYEGTGIGLAMCRKIVLNHGGEIFAESKEDQGASFHIILPVKQLLS